MVLGGSTVEGDGASGSLLALPAQIQSVLKADFLPTKPGKTTFEVINAGVGGYFSGQELLYYLSELIHYNADLVISYGGWNDIRVYNTMLEKHGPRPPTLNNDRFGTRTEILNRHFTWLGTLHYFLQRTATRTLDIVHRSAIVGAAEKAIARIRKWGSAAFSKSDGAQQSVTEKVFFSPDSVLYYARNVESLAFAVQQQGGAFAWFLQPLLGVGKKLPSDPGEEKYLSKMSKDKYRIARRRSFYKLATEAQTSLVTTFSTAFQSNPCVADLTNVFDHSAIDVFEDWGHLLDGGNTIVAKRISQELQRCGIVVRKQ